MQQIWHELSSIGPDLAVNAFSPTVSQQALVVFTWPLQRRLEGGCLGSRSVIPVGGRSVTTILNELTQNTSLNPNHPQTKKTIG